MGLNISRIGDATYGTCTYDTPHAAAGHILGAGASQVFAEGLPIARISDIVITDDGHGYTGTIIDGCVLTNAEGLLAARIGSYFTGSYYGSVIEGAANVYGG